MPAFLRRLAGKRLAHMMRPLGDIDLRPVPIPHDCHDGFLGAFWRRPEAYLDPTVRAGISVFSMLPRDEVAAAVDALRADLASGAWARRNADILDREELDLGFRVVVAEYR